MEKIHKRNKKLSVFCIWVTRRSNRLYAMFGHGPGHTEYIGLVQSHGSKVIEALIFATARFFSSSFKQW